MKVGTCILNLGTLSINNTFIVVNSKPNSSKRG